MSASRDKADAGGDAALWPVLTHNGHSPSDLEPRENPQIRETARSGMIAMDLNAIWAMSVEAALAPSWRLFVLAFVRFPVNDPEQFSGPPECDAVTNICFPYHR
jgi:hypothetical protein